MKVRTRFAPSPTGYMHIGNLRTAIFEYLLARKYNGDFILRIEDTDQARKVDGAIEFIYKTLELCGFKIDEGPMNEGSVGPYIQSERKEIYKKYAEELVEKGKAYYCFCTEEELAERRKIAESRNKPFMYDGRCSKLSKEKIEENLAKGMPYVIRQKMPKIGETLVEDVIYGKIKIDNSILEDQILLKSDGFPTYNFANVVDDHLMGITHVIRGKEYLDQTAKYNLLYEDFGWEKPTYIHVAMVLGSDGTKLSKRNGDASFMDLYNQGFLPDAIVNYLVLLGWSPSINEEVFSMDELIKNFDETRISKSSSQYDEKKLEWFNHQYIKKMDDDKYLNWVKNYFTRDTSSKSEEWVDKLLLIYKDHLNYGMEIDEVTSNFFVDKIDIKGEELEFLESDEIIPKVIETFKEEVMNINEWNVDSINLAINNVKEKTGAKGKLLYMPIRIKASGFMHGPELADTIYLIGKDTVLGRL
ncbi:MAG TPA: glutamate--tRNA ligase [Candidatus Onthocola stercorigallinarum]|nr:glutamate--tRNA ligase [Candidatus Onthocola stercorigallinarum]